MAGFQKRTWKRDGYLISTDSSLIPMSSLNQMFASKEVYWAKPLPEEHMRHMLQNSLCFGLYDIGRASDATKDEQMPTLAPSSATGALIGFGRCITDYMTFAYLTDVHVLPSHAAKGLGTWLVSCIQEVITSMPHLRSYMLLTGDWERSVPFYEKQMGMQVHEYKRPSDGVNGEGLAVMMGLGKAHFSFDTDAHH